MARNGLVHEGTHEHAIMELLSANGGGIETATFRKVVHEQVLPDRAVKTVHAVLDRIAAEGFIERRVVLTQKGIEAMSRVVRQLPFAERRNLKVESEVVVPVTVPRQEVKPKRVKPQAPVVVKVARVPRLNTPKVQPLKQRKKGAPGIPSSDVLAKNRLFPS